MLLVIQTLISVISNLKLAKDGRFYFVVDGKCKWLPGGTIAHTPAEVKASSPNTTKEAVLYHYLKSHPVLGEIRVLTNIPTDSELALYRQSADIKSPVQGLFAINGGDHVHAMLIKRLVEKGIPFRLNIAKNGCINPGLYATKADWERFHRTWKSLVDKSNFAWANASTGFFLQFPGVEGWTLAPMGLELLDAPKASKRANELARSTNMFFYTENLEDISILVKDPAIKPVARDGMTYISLSFALKLTNDPNLQFKIASGQIRRVNLRVTLPGGVVDSMPNGCLIKGDACIMPDLALDGYDIVTVSENLKDELRATEKFIMVTAFEHHPTYEATWDIQRLVMNPQILTHAHRMRDLTRLVTDAKESINNGEIPEWLLMSGNDAYDDEGMGSVRDQFNDFDTVPLRWQAAGLDIRAAQNVVRMAFGAVINRMTKFFDSVYQGEARGYAKAMWLPKSNAFVALINTHGSMTQVGGYRTPRSGTKAYFSKKYGIIIPDQRMEEIYALIGGGDLDDSVELQLVKLWSSDDSITAMMRSNGVISAAEEIPTTADDAKYTASVLRSPNGAGEFSFMEIEDILDLPWQMLDIDNVEVVDLATLPLPQAEMLTRVQVGGIQPSVTYTRIPFTRDNALRQIIAQQHNPGIGQAANTMMAWAGVAGPSMPPVIAAPFEQLVDGTQQMADPAVFQAVKDTAMLASGAAIALLESGAKVDAYLAPRFAGAKHKSIAAAHSYHGPLSEFQEAYRSAIKDLHDSIMYKSLQMREEQPIVAWVRELNFGPEAYLWADKFFMNYNGRLQAIDRDFGDIKKMSGVAKMSRQRDKSLATRSVIDDAIAELRTFERPGQRALALWYYILYPTKAMPMGIGDRLLFQQGTTEAIMDILIPVLHERGWGQ